MTTLTRTTHVRADCWITGSVNNAAAGTQYNEMFANVVQFLSGPLCSAMGISLIASNYGRGGQGLGFWDGPAPAGAGAWAVFRWNSSSYGPFDAMFMIASGTNVNSNSTAPMNIYGFTNPFANSGHGLFGVAFAATSTNADPWNGTGTFASGVIGNPVWKADANGKLCVFPRQNSPAGGTSTVGAFATSRNYMMGLDGNTTDTIPMRMHVMVTAESFTHLLDPGVTSNYVITHFGPWSPRVGLNGQDVQYVLLGSGMTTPTANAPPLLWTSTGNTFGNASSTSAREGGLAHPNAVSGSRSFGISTPNTALPSNTFWNTLLSGSGAYDVMPFYLVMFDGLDVGIVGTVNETQYVYGTPCAAVTLQSSSIAIGLNTSQSAKWLLPWAGPPPGALPINNHGHDT